MYVSFPIKQIKMFCTQSNRLKAAAYVFYSMTCSIYKIKVRNSFKHFLNHVMAKRRKRKKIIKVSDKVLIRGVRNDTTPI